MEIVEKKPSELIPYANNSRTHSDDQVAQICASIREYGFTNPILIDEEGTIIAGHGRAKAATITSRSRASRGARCTAGWRTAGDTL